MQNTRSAETPGLEVIHQLFATATQDASAAMSRWTNGLITLTLDEVRELPLESACLELDLGDDLLTMVVLSLDGFGGAQMILTFDEENGRRLAASLLRRPINDEPEWSELERSALTETGNILSCAYLNALTRLLGTELVPSPPYFMQDYGASVLEQALLTQAAASDTVLVAQTRFERAGQELNWNVLFVPSPELRQHMEHALETLD